jgi:hypothetical protein
VPRSDDQNDYLHTFTVEGEGKSKSTRIAPLEVGRNDAPTRLLALDEIGSSSVRTPPAGTRLLHYDDNGVLVSETGSGTTEEVRGADELVTLTGSPVPVGAGTSLEIEQGQSIQDDTGTDRITVGSSAVEIATLDVNTFSTTPRFDQGLAVSTGQSLVDGSGTDRLVAASENTQLRDETGGEAVSIGATGNITLLPDGDKNVQVFDDEGTFPAINYQTSPSTPGVFELTNAELKREPGYVSDLTREGTVADDDVLSLDAASRQLVIVTVAPKDAGLFATGFDSVDDLSSSAVFTVVGNNTTLTGTTGPDGGINIAVDDNVFFVENRTGGSRDVRIQARQ